MTGEHEEIVQPVSVQLTERARTLEVALLRVPWVLFVRSPTGGGPMPPIGLAYIAAAVRAAGHDVQIVDAAVEDLESFEEFESSVGTIRRVGLSPQEAVDRIRPGTTLIGITHMFLHEWPTVQEMAELARRRFPDAVIVVGGENATNFWPWMFELTDAIDAVVRGEGEATMAELADRVARGQRFDDLLGLAVSPRSGRATSDNGLPVRIRQVNEITRPAWDLFPMEKYFAERSYFGVHRGRTIPMLATRGCPHQCSFCSSPQMWTTRYFVRDPDDIADEIADYVERYGIRNVDFADLTAITKRKWTLEFCDALERRGVDVTWQLPAGTRSEVIDATVLRRIYDAGCRNITLAPETGSPRMVEIFNKRVDLEHVLEGIREAHRVGLVVHVNTIIGHPEENWNDRWRNFTFLLRAAAAGADTCNASIFHPYPGSKDFEDLVEAGKIEIDEEFLYDGLLKTSPGTRSWNENVSSMQLYLTQLGTVLIVNALNTLRHPYRAWHLVRALFGGDEHNFIEQQMRVRLRKGRGSAIKKQPRSAAAATAPRQLESPTTAAPSSSPATLPSSEGQVVSKC